LAQNQAVVNKINIESELMRSLLISIIKTSEDPNVLKNARKMLIFHKNKKTCSDEILNEVDNFLNDLSS
jgi:hypothetical protein